MARFSQTFPKKKRQEPSRLSRSSSGMHSKLQRFIIELCFIFYFYHFSSMCFFLQHPMWLGFMGLLIST